MKKVILLFVVLATQINFAQNTFPASGNVGLGVVNPQVKLDVLGAGRFRVPDDQSGIGGLTIETLNGTNLKLGGNSTYSWIQSHASLPLYINELGNNTIINPRYGNVGIGTASPETPLHVFGALTLGSQSVNANTTKLFLRNPAGKTWAISSGANMVTESSFSIYNWSDNQSSPLFHINENGNVGIGNAGPDAKLVVNGDAKIKQNLFISGLSGGYSAGDNPVLYFGVNSDFAKISVPFGDKMILSSYHGYTFNTSNNGSIAVPAFTIGITGNVGIGTTNPTSKLESINTIAGISSFKSIGTNGYIIIDNVGSGENYYNANKFQEFQINNVSKMRINVDGNVGIGTTNPLNKLDVNGTIHSKEVKVDMTGWSDFVFKKEYNLPTLDEVEKHIAEKGHLENIPSEAEVLKNGINLGEMNAKLLQKIEELTLYMIEMRKENMEIKNKQLEFERTILKLNKTR